MPKTEYGKDLYILWIDDAQICKIGRSTDTKRRLKEIQAYCPWVNVEIAMILPGAGWLETTVHGAFKAKRCGREWFRVHKTEAIETANMLLRCLDV